MSNENLDALILSLFVNLTVEEKSTFIHLFDAAVKEQP